MNVFTHLYVVFELGASSSKILLGSLFFFFTSPFPFGSDDDD